MREICFGDDEGLHFDTLKEDEKKKFSDFNHQFSGENGESWVMVQDRVNKFLQELNSGNHMVFTHGGPLIMMLNKFGVEKIPNNGSIFGVVLDQANNNEIRDLDF